METAFGLVSRELIRMRHSAVANGGGGGQGGQVDGRKRVEQSCRWVGFSCPDLTSGDKVSSPQIVVDNDRGKDKRRLGDICMQKFMLRVLQRSWVFLTRLWIEERCGGGGATGSVGGMTMSGLLGRVCPSVRSGLGRRMYHGKHARAQQSNEDRLRYVYGQMRGHLEREDSRIKVRGVAYREVQQYRGVGPPF